MNNEITDDMQRLLTACKAEVDSKDLLNKELKKRVFSKDALITAIESCDKLPKSARKIIGDRMFYKTTRTRG